MADGRSVDLPRFHAPLDFESRWDTGPGTILVKSVNWVVAKTADIEYSKNVKQPQNRADYHGPYKNPLNGGFHRNKFDDQPKQEINYNDQNKNMNHEYRISTNGGLLG